MQPGQQCDQPGDDQARRIVEGLVHLALLIYEKAHDSRDALLVLSLLNDAAVKVGNLPKAIFNEIDALFGESSFLSDFLGRSAEDKSIDSMGYEESKNEEGFLYVRTW